MTLIPSFILSSSTGEFRNWVRANQLWVDRETSTFCHENSSEMDIISKLTLFLKANEGRQSVISHKALFVKHNFLTQIAEAGTWCKLGTATGRVSLNSAGTITSIRGSDDMPAAISAGVVDWCPHPEFHAIACRWLPPYFLWISPEMSFALHGAAQSADSVTIAFERFYSSVGHFRTHLHLYMPSIRTYPLSALPSI